MEYNQTFFLPNLKLKFKLYILSVFFYSISEVSSNWQSILSTVSPKEAAVVERHEEEQEQQKHKVYFSITVYIIGQVDLNAHFFETIQIVKKTSM